ncbi:pqn-73 [Pristionchus pacificus]|uniref:Pqn-73 n=1 Tax=Pristionchus pacificus TaxID=54126 RepID=A0A2A6BRQ9_PRIPA|nr:pqn-73 [Pristionchus pacificus]|eukprot:PDM68506.1 pqn-73 [Pristionchus pacificus]
MARLPTHFLNLDTEPKGAAPPAYRALTNTASDSWSVNSQDKRKSWTGLVDSNENLNKYRVNHYPKVHKDQPVMQRHTYFGSACQLGQVSAAPLARPTNSSMSNMSEIVAFSMPKGPYPVRADPIFIPASGGGSYPPSENMAPLPLQPDSRPEVPQPPKRNRLQELRAYCCSPKVTLIFFIVLLFLIIAAIVAIVVTQAYAMPKTLSMMWQAPTVYRGGQTAASHIDMNGETEGRVRFAMKGATPFKGNFIAYYDFKSGKAVIVDESLKKNGEQFTCFVLPIDTANTPTYEEMLKAAARAKSRIGQPEGWDEEWTMVPSPLEAAMAKAQFNPPIPECDKARWIQLQKAAGDQRNQKCAECHDFCLPEFGIQGTATEGYLNIIHRDCFHLFVPEWRSYAQSATPEQNQRDFEAFYRNRKAAQNGADTTGSKWIPLAGMRPPNPPFGPSSPQSIPAPSMPMQQGMQPQQQNNGYGLPMQPYGVNQQQQLQQGIQQPTIPMGQQRPDAAFQPYGVQPGQQQGMQPNAMGTSNGGMYQNGVFGLQQQVANAGQSAVNTIGNAVSDIRQGATNIYNAGAQQSLAGVVNQQTAGTGSSMGGVGGYGQRLLGYGSGGVSNNGGTVDWPGSSQQQQTTYPGGFAPNGNLQSTALEAGIPGVNNPQYYQNGQQQHQLPNKMGDLTGYAPNVVSTTGGGLQQLGAASNDPRQLAGVIGMQPSGPTSAPSSGYVPDVVMPQPPPQQQQQQMLLPNSNQLYGRGR